MQVIPHYRADIDGLRAVAIISVVVFHAFPNALPGGFVGVDVFFVISGFLIASIILRALQADRFSFVAFYMNRAKRIFPALVLVLLACYGFGVQVLLPSELKQFGEHMVASAFFVQNFALLGEAGYFDTATEFKPLMHLWSLAVEEQFYLLFPLVVWGAWRLGISILATVLVLLLVSFGINVHGVDADPVGTFFRPHTRFWELLVGSALAYLYLFRRKAVVDHWGRGDPGRERLLDDLLSCIGLALIVIAWVVIDKGSLFPGWIACLPVAGSGLLLLAGPQGWVNRVILARRPMVLVGLISYPLYLWHWPLLSFAHIMENGTPSWHTRTALVSLSVVLAWLTYRYVERPLRFGRSTRDGIKTGALVACMALAGCLGFDVVQRDGLKQERLQFEKVVRAVGEWKFPGNLRQELLGDIGYLAKPSHKRSTTLFVGDSNMEQFYARFDALIDSDPDRTNSVAFKTGAGCFPVPGVHYAAGYRHCDRLMQDSLTLARTLPGVETVVIGGQWNGYLWGGFGLTRRIERGSAEYQAALHQLSAFIRELTALDKRVFLVLNIPVGRELDPKHLVQRSLHTFPQMLSVRSSSVDRGALESRFGTIQSDVAQAAVQAGAEVIDPKVHLCQSSCPALEADGEPIYMDYSHLRPSFVRRQVTFLDRTVQD